MVAMERCLSDAFLRLTKGEAVYGQPGVACRGPYRVTGFELKVGEGSDVD
jgi:hypothetical protein